MDQHEVDGALAGLASELESTLGQSFSAAAYGSVVRGDWLPGRSDVNVIVVLDDASPANLARLTPAVKSWHERGYTPPLFIARAEWARAADVFPIEITDMQLAHRVLHGDDPIVGVVVDPPDLRRAIEAELRGKLIRLRQAYVRFGTTPAILGGYATTSAPSLLVLLRCTAVLLGRDPGRFAVDTVGALHDILGPDADVLSDVIAHRRDPEWNCPAGVFERYLAVVRRAVDIADTHTQQGAG
ncbi:MAG: nucleotidyltransferase domain-containing protein [Gemmatimonadales bacterium]|nr:nucleotidyltransferase domain-containing protein [Gemmatimonadales bacterium]